MIQKQIVPIETPDPDEVVSEFPISAPHPATPAKWPMGRSLRLIIVTCGLFWLTVAAVVFAYLH